MASRLPSLRGIETFLCVAEVLNLRLASERLGVTVSAISHRILGLEHDLGLQLFDRSNRRLRLTLEGGALLERLRPGIRMLQDATLTTRRKPATPVLRVAAPPLFNYWLLGSIREFQASHPGLRIELVTSGRRRSASVDITIAPLTTASQREGALPVLDIQIAPVCSPAFLAENPIEVAQDCLDLPLIDTLPVLGGWEAWFAASGVDEDRPDLALALDNQALLYTAVVEGRGLGMGVRGLVADYVRQGVMVEPLPVYCKLGPPLAGLVNDAGNTDLAHAFLAWLSVRLDQA